MQFGFSVLGTIFLLLFILPNLFWTRNQPVDYAQYAKKQKPILLLLERVGEVCVSVLAVVSADLRWLGKSPQMIWLLLATLLILLYEVYWVRYFQSAKTMSDFYRDLLGVPVTGATLPVMAFVCLSIYGRNPLLFAAAVVLGIGHIGIHRAHQKEVEVHTKQDGGSKDDE